MDVEKLHNEVLRAFNDSCVIATGGSTAAAASVRRPTPSSRRTTREIVVRFDLAGMAMGDIELLVDRRELVVRGERSFPTREGRVYQQVEMDYGPFERRVRLMVDVDPEVTTATYEAGVLEVRLTLAERRSRAPARSTSRPGEVTHERPTGDRRSKRPPRRRSRRVLPVLPLRDTVVFPDTMIPLTIGQERSIKLIDDVLAGDRLLAMVTSRDAEVETPGPDLLYPVGTVGLAHKMIKLPDGTMRILVQGLQRVRVKEYVQRESRTWSRAPRRSRTSPTESKESDALRASLLSVFSKIVALVPYLPEELEMAAANVEEPGPLTFLIASTMRIKAEDKQALLEEDDVEQRMRKLIGILTRELDVLELGSKIQSDVRGEIDKSQREYFLRQQMQAPSSRSSARPTSRKPRSTSCARRSRSWRSRRRPTRRPAGSSTASQHLAAERRVSGHPHLPRLDHHPALDACTARTTSTWRTRARSWTATTTTSRRSRTASSSSWPCASSRTTCTGRSCASSARPAWARRASATASPRRWAASSSASASAACATRPRSAGIAAPTWARCPASSSAPCATPAPTTRCS